MRARRISASDLSGEELRALLSGASLAKKTASEFIETADCFFKDKNSRVFKAALDLAKKFKKDSECLSSLYEEAYEVEGK